MTYSVKEIYYTLQGEGVNAGRPAVFLRFTGCNLWSGLEDERDLGSGPCSAWCDTDFVGTDGPGGGRFDDAMSLAEAAAGHWYSSDEHRFIVLTGGEPLLQLDRELLVQLHAQGFEVAVETNGTRRAPDDVDWICVSPKAGVELEQCKGQELKLVYPQEGSRPEDFEDLEFENFLLQPLDGPEVEENTRLAVDFCLHHPKWRLTLQSHKALGLR